MSGMTIDALVDSVRVGLRAQVDAEFQRGQLRFFQEEVRTYGVRSPGVKRVATDVYHAAKAWPPAERNQFCERLWQSGMLEEGAVVIYFYRRLGKQCGAPEFRLFEKWIDRYVHNWAHCDGVSSWLLASCIANDPGLIAKLPAWTGSRNRWKRRAAAVALLQEGKRGRHTKDIFRIATPLMADPDDMVQKGVGWLLKETYPKKPREVVQFLQPWKSCAPRLLLRYAAEKMTAHDRAALLR
jgi:3-methyladenine DNA glycosylase AlkD